jgi:hypothetical protein
LHVVATKMFCSFGPRSRSGSKQGGLVVFSGNRWFIKHYMSVLWMGTGVGSQLISQ